jgi:hypothetical protein
MVWGSGPFHHKEKLCKPTGWPARRGNTEHGSGRHRGDAYA